MHKNQLILALKV